MQENSNPQTPEAKTLKKSFPFICWINQRKGKLFWYFISLSLILLLLFPHVVIFIDPGYLGVLYKRFDGGTVMDKIYGEGTHLIAPWNKMYFFDVRIQQETQSFRVISTNGMIIEVETSIRFQPMSDKLPQLLTTVGMNYKEKLVIPSLASALQVTATRYQDKNNLYGISTERLQDEVQVITINLIGRSPVKIDSVLIRKIRLPDPLNEAINDKLIAEQQIFRETFRVGVALERYKIRVVDALGTRVAQQLVNENMTEPYLRWQGIEATKELSGSTNSKMVIMGGKDGLPVILNPDAPLSPVQAKPQPAAPQSGVTDTPPLPSAEPAPLEQAKAKGLDSQAITILEKSFKLLEQTLLKGIQPPGIATKTPSQNILTDALP